MALVFCSQKGSQCVKIEQQVIDAIVANSKKWHPKETGGVLLGYYNDSYKLLTICIACPPPVDSKHGHFYFERATKGLQKLINWGRKQSPGLIYVGEWHTHPDNQPIPSLTDKKQMKDFARRHLYNSSSPVLLILGGSPFSELLWGVTVYYQEGYYRNLNLLK